MELEEEPTDQMEDP